ncbi:uncharacterized protein LOC144103822 [Amblyomma americanum]
MLCELCYDRSAQDEARVCPLDGRLSEDRDVELRELDCAELLGREVKCWNQESGCEAVLPASKIAQHFQTGCGHHSVYCRKCSATVLHNDICAHMKSEYCTSATPLPPEYGRDSRHKGQPALLTSDTQTLQGPRGDLKAIPDMRLIDSSEDVHQATESACAVEKCHQTLRHELQRGINSVKETMRREVARMTSEHREGQRECLNALAALRDETREHTFESDGTLKILSTSVKRLVNVLEDERGINAGKQLERVSQIGGLMEEVREEVTECKKLINQIVKMLRNTNVQGSRYDFFVKSVQSLREAALKNGFAVYQGDKVYLLGYYLSPGVYLQKQGESVTLHARIRLNVGDMDDIVQWPFTKAVKLRVLHPTQWAEREINETISSNVSGSERPDESSTAAVYTTSSLNLDDLINDGYVQRDELRVKFQVQP